MTREADLVVGKTQTTGVNGLMSDIKIFTKNIEEKAMEQINTLIALPVFSECKVRIMPDVHAGAGCVIGFTADLGDKVIPNVVGVDIGCGLLAAEIGTKDIDYERLDSVIYSNVPSGFSVNNNPNEEAINLIEQLLCKDSLHNTNRLIRSMGTLGGGNHFIEVDCDEDGAAYLVIHTGSRNVGLQVANYYQDVAVDRWYGKSARKESNEEIINKLKAEGRESEISSALKELKSRLSEIPKQLCYLEGKDRIHYLHDMDVCQKFAAMNRLEIATRIAEQMKWEYKGFIHSVHNYIDFEDNIVRKGAISARIGQKLIIPMNMRDGCIIGFGKGNDDWNQSAPHGAGRVMSRMAAKKTVSMKDYQESMQGIYTTSVDESTLDECPMAYKPMQEIVDLIEPTVEIKKIIKPVYNFKAAE